jgi:hypothetical protein
MWVNKALFQRLMDESQHTNAAMRSTVYENLKAQHARDTMTIDWMRHRINALEKERAILLNKVAGVIIPVPEIVPTRPGTLSRDIPDFDSLPSFEDVGDGEAHRLGIAHNDAGGLVFTK